MCNPRRVMIHLNRVVEQGWRTAIEQVQTLQDEVRQTARVTAEVPLDAEMGDLPLQMLERLMRGDFEGFEAWQRDEQGRYHHDLDDVTLTYDPATRRLTVEAGLAQQISVEARAVAEASGIVVGDVAVEAVGHYYSDNWGGRTEESARKDAAQEAERKLAEAIDALGREQNRPQVEQAEARARAEAQREAETQLEQRRQAVREALRRQIQSTLAAAQERVQLTMNRLVGEAYRRSLIQLVQDNGGRVLRDQQTGSLIDMELELF